MNSFRNLDIDSVANGFNTFTMKVNDYEMITPSLAHVVVTYTGNAPTQEEIRAGMAKMLNGQAVPVAQSFRKVTDGVVAGFVKAGREVREYDEQLVTAGKMKVMASNLLMDTEDQALYEVKESASGKYMVRQGNDDLSALVHLACRMQVGQPTFAHIASVPVEPREFAAYVSPDTEEVEHGYVIASAEGKMTVLPCGSDTPTEITSAHLVEVVNLDGEDVKAFGKEMAAGVAGDKAAMIEYYKALYGYDPAYLAQVIQCINMHAFA